MNILNWQSYLIAAAAGALIAGAGAGIGAWQWQANKYEAQLSAKQEKYEKDMGKVSKLAATAAQKALTKHEADTETIAALDKQLVKVNHDAKIEQDRLKRDIDTGARKLRINGICIATSSGSVPSETGATGIGYASTIELAPEARQDYYDLRAGIQNDQAALTTLQNYVTNVCLRK